MISFIIIGRNEGWKLTKCFESVFDTISYNTLSDYEVIYVDSKSTDNSIERAKEFETIKIFQLTGDINAAIARNIGAKESKGNVLFFIDGDMEIIPEFLQLVYSPTQDLIHPFVSGNWANYFYNANNEIIRKETFREKDNDTKEKVTGGLFLIRKETWNKVSGMNPMFKKSQDIDLGLRLAKKGVFLLRKKDIAAIHHTISYLDKNRMWKDFFKWNHLYGRSLLYRKNIFNFFMYKRLVRNDYSMLFLLLITPVVCITNQPLLYLLYIILVLFRAKYIATRILFFIIRDILSLLGLFLFWPKKSKNISYYLNNA